MDLVDRLSFIFGTDEAVKRRRQLTLLRENILNTLLPDGPQYSVICSGSLGEGVTYPRSDDDKMYFDRRQCYQVYDSYEEALNHQAFYMIPSPYSSGFCLLQYPREIASCLALSSSKEFRDFFCTRLPGTEPHGPCASQTLGINEFDHAQCLSCQHWPAIAHEWITRRRRYGYPSRELIEKIIRSGCHVVPIGNPDSPLCDFEWRVSFSVAERSLIYEFNHVQFIVYNLVKLVLKKVISCRVPNVLCSYFLKTVLFYVIENTNLALWVNDSIEECYRKCLLLLYQFIDARNCPNYFVPANNMMRRKITPNNRIPLLVVVSELMSHGIVGSLRLCGEDDILSPLLSPVDIESQNDYDLLNSFQMRIFMNDYDSFIARRCRHGTCHISLRNMLSPILSSYQYIHRYGDSALLNVITRRVLTKIGLECIKITIGMTQRNKSKYHALKCGQAMLKMGYRSDVSSGRLQMANYMFMTGRFHQCLAIIQAVFTKMKQHVMSRRPQKANCDIYRDVICNNGYSLDYKVRKAWAVDVQFILKSYELAPIPLKLFLRLQKFVTLLTCSWTIFLPPLIFAYFLQGLCFHRTSDFHSMNISVTLLDKIMRELPSERMDDIHFCRLLLGYMKLLQQEYASSCRCFTSGYLMKNEMEKTYKTDYSEPSQAFVILIACLLNRGLWRNC